MQEDLKYVTCRKNADGTLRYYWQRKGHPLKRLPVDPVARFAEAHRLNAMADKGGAIVKGSVSWTIGRYKESDKFTSKAPRTQRAYGRWLDEIEAMWGALPFAAIDRQVVVDFIESINGTSTRKHAAAVLLRLFWVAIYHGFAKDNHARQLDLGSAHRRTELWSDDDVAAIKSAARDGEEAEAVILGFVILRNFAQRPGDVLQTVERGVRRLGLQWSQYDGIGLEVRQEKTGTPVRVPCTTDLKAALDAAKATTRGLAVVARTNGRPMSYNAWSKLFRAAREKAGLGHLQARDLRRTAMVEMGRAGATVVQIAAVSGHTITRTQAILEHYLPRDSEMAEAAILKLETYRERKV